MLVSKLKPNPDNPRTISADHLSKLKKSITEFKEMMSLRPIIYDPKTMIVLGGNQRLAAITALEMTEIPDDWVKAAIGLTPEQQKEFILKDNVPLGEWDWDLLMADWDTDMLDDFGIEIPEFGTGKAKTKASEDDYQLPPLDEIQTNIELGDVITIGHHRIICGDSTEEGTFRKLMNERKADMVFTDPPYNINYSGKGKKTNTTIANDNMDRASFEEFLTAAFARILENTKANCGIYVCHNYAAQREFENAMNIHNLIVKNQIVWVKPSAGMGMGDYRQMHELLFYASPGKKTVKFYGDRKQYTVWKAEYTDEQIVKAVRRAYERQTNGASTVWEFGRDSNYVHPTQKPVLLCAKAIENSSKEEDIVMDAFLGSGSTMVAAHQLNRICYGAEMEPRYCQAIINRMLELQPDLRVTINDEEYSA